jgi:cytochrome c553
MRMNRTGPSVSLLVALAVAAACGSSAAVPTPLSNETTPGGGTGAGGALGGGSNGTGSPGSGGNGSQGTGGNASGSAGAAQGAGGSSATPSGLPCDVEQVLASACVTCHSSPPVNGAPTALVSYADLTAPSAIDPNQTYAQRCVVRMQDAAKPMPPGQGVTMTPAQVAAFQAFIDGGYPKGECGAIDAGPSPDAGPPVSFPNDPPKCTSNLTWLFGNSLGDLMNPGKACNACHAQKGKVVFAVAGTVYPTGHEPDLCVGSGANGATIEITDANGNTTKLSANFSGNFDAKSIAGFTPPYTAKVVFNGQERAMVTPQTSGDCNSCHTQDGANGAPGRIRLP